MLEPRPENLRHDFSLPIGEKFFGIFTLAILVSVVILVVFGP